MAGEAEEPTNGGTAERLSLAELIKKRDALGEEIVRSVRGALASIPRVTLLAADEDALRILVPVAYRIFAIVKARFGVPWERVSISPNWAAAEGWATAISDEDKRQKKTREDSSFAAAQEVVRKAHGDEIASDPASVRFAQKALTQQSWDDLARTSRAQTWPGTTLQELEKEAAATGTPFKVLRRKLDPKSPRAISLESDLALMRVFSKSDIFTDIDRAATASGAIAVLRRVERRAALATDLPGGQRYTERANPLLTERAAFEAQVPPPDIRSRRQFYARFASEWERAGLFPAVCPSCGVWFARVDRRTRGCSGCIASDYQRARRANTAAAVAAKEKQNLRALLSERARHLAEDHRKSHFLDCARCHDLDTEIAEARNRPRRPVILLAGEMVQVEEMQARRARGRTR